MLIDSDIELHTDSQIAHVQQNIEPMGSVEVVIVNVCHALQSGFHRREVHAPGQCIDRIGPVFFRTLAPIVKGFVIGDCAHLDIVTNWMSKLRREYFVDLFFHGLARIFTHPMDKNEHVFG